VESVNHVDKKLDKSGQNLNASIIQCGSHPFRLSMCAQPMDFNNNLTNVRI
jgi:hypothetical protein